MPFVSGLANVGGTASDAGLTARVQRAEQMIEAAVLFHGDDDVADRHGRHRGGIEAEGGRRVRACAEGARSSLGGSGVGRDGEATAQARIVGRGLQIADRAEAKIALLWIAGGEREQAERGDEEATRSHRRSSLIFLFHMNGMPSNSVTLKSGAFAVL